MSQRLFFLRKLNSFHIDSTLLHLFYTSVIESVLLFCFHAWGGNCKLEKINCFQRTIKKCLKICNMPIYSVNSLLDKLTSTKMKRILKDKAHPLFSKILFSNRKQGRLLSLMTKTERYRKSFLPRAVKSVSL